MKRHRPIGGTTQQQTTKGFFVLREILPQYPQDDPQHVFVIEHDSGYVLRSYRCPNPRGEPFHDAELYSAFLTTTENALLQERWLNLVPARRAPNWGEPLTQNELDDTSRHAIETGLRVNQLRALQVKDCDFNTRQITVRDATGKGAKTRHQPLKPKTALELQQYVSNKLPETAVLYVTDKAAKMLRADLAAAGIEYKIDGQDFDFHALRHEHASLLSASRNVSPQTVQQSMGHSSMTLTYGVYVHASDEPLRQAIEALPDLAQPSATSRHQSDTGTNSTNR